MAWICAVRRKESGKGLERLYFRDDERTGVNQAQLLTELFQVQRLTGISLRNVDKAELPKLTPLKCVLGVQIHYEALL